MVTLLGRLVLVTGSAGGAVVELLVEFAEDTDGRRRVCN